MPMSDSAGGDAQDTPEWLPDEYDPDAPLRERLPIMAEIEGGIELHAQDDRGTVEILGSPKELTSMSLESGDRLTLKTGGGTGRHKWSWEIVVPAKGDPVLKDVDPMQDFEAYRKTKTTWMDDVDVRIYGVDADRFEESEVSA